MTAMSPTEMTTKLKDLMYEIELDTIKSDSKVKTIKSLDDYFTANGFLTKPQQDLLRKIYEEVIG